MRTKSYRSQHLARYQRAVESMFIRFDDKLRDVIATPRYWEGFEGSTTYRQNGEVVIGAFRNIIDTSSLASSQQTSISNGTMAVTWMSQETPVESVFFGYRTSGGGVPGRNWIMRALEEFDPVEEIINNL